MSLANFVGYCHDEGIELHSKFPSKITVSMVGYKIANVITSPNAFGEFGETSRRPKSDSQNFSLIPASIHADVYSNFHSEHVPQRRGLWGWRKHGVRGRNGFHIPYESDNWDTLYHFASPAALRGRWRPRVEGEDGKGRMMVECERGRGNNITLIDEEVALSLR